VSGAKIDKLVRMANQIGDFFAPMPEETGTQGAANHLKRYWTPKMISEMIVYLDSGGSGLNGTAGRAVDRLKQESNGVS
jgi:formate dehydrogenase subunit delta